MNIAVIYSKPTRRALSSAYCVADDDTVHSAQKVSYALQELGNHVHIVGIHEDSIVQTIRSIHADLIFNLIDWTGEDLPLSLIAMDELERTGIPFAGASKENFLLVDKIRMKQALWRKNLPTGNWQLFHTGDEPIDPSLTFPALVKLGREHCSIGLEKSSFVANKEQIREVVKDRLTRFHQDVYAEEFIPGREFQITVLDRPHGLTMLPPAEIMYKKTASPEFLTFSERWDESDPEYLRSDTHLATLPTHDLHVFSHVSTQAFKELGFRDFTRIDAKQKPDGTFLILEINPNPGLDDDPLYSMTISASAVGLTFAQFLKEIIDSVLRRTSLGQKAWT